MKVSHNPYGKRLLSLLILVLLIFSLFSIFNVKVLRVSAVEYPAIMVIPEETVNSTLTPGTNFTISIYTDYTGFDVTAYQFTLSYDPSVINGVNVTNGDLIVGGSAEFTAGTFDNTAGTLSLTAGYYTVKEFTSGPGTLANVTFTVVGIGISNITIGGETKLLGVNIFTGEEYVIIDAYTMPDHIQHGSFNNKGGTPFHDVAVIGLTAPAEPVAGKNITIDVQLRNEGTYNETVNVTVSYDLGLIGSNETILSSPGILTVSFIWNTPTVTENTTYTINATATIAEEGSEYLDDNTKTTQITLVARHDVAIKGDLEIPSEAFVGELVNISMIVENQGSFDENVTLTVKSTPEPGVIHTENFILNALTSHNVSFSWDTRGLKPGTYDIRADVVIDEDEDTLDNKKLKAGFKLKPSGAIAGRVTDLTGDPIPGATVTANGYSNTTDANGFYTIADVPPGDYTVTAEATGYVSDSKPASIEWKNTTTVNFELKLIVGWIEGYVIDNAGAPIADATVTADTVASNTTNNAGYYKIEIVPGTYTLTASKPGYLDDVVYDVSVSAAKTETHNFTLEPILVSGWINGTVTDASTGKPIPGAIVTADGVSALTDTDGHYSILVPAPNSYTVTASASGYYTSQPKTDIFVDISATQIVDFTLTPLPGAIDGKVTDASTGNPIEGATVTADGYSATTNTDGFYTIADVPPGDYTVTVSAAEYFSDSKPASVESEKTTTVNFALQLKPGQIAGTVTDALTGNPIFDATVAVAGYSTTTNIDGEYTIPDLSPGTYTVFTSATGYFPILKSVTVIGGEITTVNLALQPILGRIEGYVTDNAGAPIADATVTADTVASNTTNNAGYYKIEIVPGTYTVTVSAAGYESASKHNITVVAEEITTVNFTLRIIITITLSANPTTIKVGESTTLNISVSPPLEGLNITIQYRLTDEETWTSLTTLITNENGQQSYTWTPETAGTYKFKAIWLGDESTTAAESDEQTITVQETPPPSIPWRLYLGAAAAVAILIIAIAFYILKIRKPKPT